MTSKERFIEIYRANIKREGAEELLNFLLSDHSDFFTAPASTRFHGAYEGGLLEHSLNVYDCMCDILARPRMQDVYGIHYSAESAAIVALLHDLCKVNFYKVTLTALTPIPVAIMLFPTPGGPMIRIFSCASRKPRFPRSVILSLSSVWLKL